MVIFHDSLHGRELNEERISKHFKGSNFWVENYFSNKSSVRNIIWLKKTIGKKNKGFQEIEWTKMWIGIFVHSINMLVALKHIKARLSHMKKGDDHICYTNKIM